MSYDIKLVDPVTKETLNLENNHFMTGGTYAIGGTTECWLNITYNYARWYYKPDVFPENPKTKETGIRSIYGLSGAESIPVLKHAIDSLNNLDEDLSIEEKEKLEKQNVTGYWLPTKINAIKPLYQLIGLAQLRPDGIWEGD